MEIKATGICHTDEFTRSGSDPEGLFPSILGHEGAGAVVETGLEVTSVKRADRVIPLYTPECRQCEYCLSEKTNLCQAIRVTQGQGVMPDGTGRFSLGGEPLYHYMGTSTFVNFTVLPEIAVAKIREDAPFRAYAHRRIDPQRGHLLRRRVEPLIPACQCAWHVGTESAEARQSQSGLSWVVHVMDPTVA